MRQEILALCTGHPTLPPDTGLELVETGGFIAAFAPTAPPWIFGKALTRRRLSDAPKRQRWLEELMSAGTVIPFVPGSVLERREAGALVQANADIFDDLVRRLSDRLQFQVTVSWTEDRVLERFRAAPEIAPLFSQAVTSAAAIAAAVSKLAERLAQTVAGHLADVSGEMAELPRETAMLSNSVLLVRKDRQDALDAALADIDAIWPEGLLIRQIGPGPAVSFSSLRLRRHDVAEVKAARKALGLAPGSTEEDVREARQKLLRSPDADVSAIRAAARLADAAIRSGVAGEAINLVESWSEGRSIQPGLQQVA